VLIIGTSSLFSHGTLWGLSVFNKVEKFPFSSLFSFVLDSKLSIRRIESEKIYLPIVFLGKTFSPSSSLESRIQSREVLDNPPIYWLVYVIFFDPFCAASPQLSSYSRKFVGILPPFFDFSWDNFRVFFILCCTVYTVQWKFSTLYTLF